MKYLISFIASTFLICQGYAQNPFNKSADTYQLIYGSTNNGKKTGNNIIVLSNREQTLVVNEKDFKGEHSYPFEFFVVNRQSLQQSLYAVLAENKIIGTVDSTAIKNQTFEWFNETKTILGYTCKKAKTVINSNTIELWYSTDAPVKGAPTILGQNIGLVLEMVRNGNFTLTASEIKKMPNAQMQLNNTNYQKMDLLSYKDEIWRSRFVTIPLFNNQLINFSDTATVPEGVLRFASGTIVLKKVSFPKFSGAKKIFLDLTEQSNGDAYDRTGSVFMISSNKKQSFFDALKNGADVLPVFENGNGKKYKGVIATSNYDPPIELMRFFTPFGVKQFNHIQLKGKLWRDAVHYRQEITDFASLLNGSEMYIGVFIGNYDKGGHRINAGITIHKDEGTIPTKLFPLFNTLNIMEMAGQDYATMFDNENGLTINFELNEPIQNAKLRYTTTGHGGWGNGDEFVPKQNSILLDNKEVFNLIPWREDCGSYRLYNPASGNFGNGLSSSDYSRSNWCPGTVTNPYFILLGNLPAGKHTMQVKIPQGKPEGSSFSSWNVSGVLIGE
ncbi:MAG TPA: PNGase F N-terminal domain-containing protein [Ferruginibacter sp.]|nr:PNGase F N-terminal domain-containing protein [Ferruginibacter sp.]HRE63552.1 PNGase F N-terminal domain-containing protein [Ferruginibacter sp.]